MKISVVIPAYNEEKHIGSCLEHFLKQEEKADEIIVVDNNSTDNTAKIANKYGAIVIREIKQGMIHARNTGFNSAKFEIIARTDADTYVPKNWIKIIKENFTKNKNLVGLSGTTHFYDFPIHNRLQHSQWQNKIIFAFIKSQIKHATLYGPNMAIQKKAWEKIKNEVCLDDTAVHEDTDLAIHLGRLGDIKIDPTLVSNTSFRRYKKPHTYIEYSHRLLKTFKKHNSKKHGATSHNTSSYHHDIGLIDVLWKEFKSTNRMLEDAAIVYLPGWSLYPSSQPVEKLCQKIADTLHIQTYAIQTKPENIINNSLFYEGEAIRKLLPEIMPSVKKIVLITHSQGTIKTIHLAHLFQKTLSPVISGIILITPVGLYNLSRQALIAKFFGEILKTISESLAEIVTLKNTKSAFNLTSSVISYIKNEIRMQTPIMYSKRLNNEALELTKSHLATIDKLQKMRIPIFLILAQNDLVSSIKKIKEILNKSGIQDIHVSEIKQANHAMPYTQTDMLVKEIFPVTKRLF